MPGGTDAERGAHPSSTHPRSNLSSSMIPRTLLTWLLILGVLVGGAAAAGVWAKSWWEQRSAPKYLTATISRGRVETVVNSTGTIKPVLSVSVGAFTSGPIAKVYVDFNSAVKKDQLLA